MGADPSPAVLEARAPSCEPGGASPNGAERMSAFLRLAHPTAGVRGCAWSFWEKKRGKKLRQSKIFKRSVFFLCGSPRREDGALAVNYEALSAGDG